MSNKFAHLFDTASDEDQVLQYAQKYLLAGFCPVPVHPNSKNPIGVGWTSLRISFEDLADHFFSNRNIGIILGDASRGLVDIDVDSKEANLLASFFLPPTDCIFGRKSKPDSHWVYRVTGATKTTKREDDHECIIEVRNRWSNGVSAINAQGYRRDHRIFFG